MKFANILTATYAATVDGADTQTAARSAFPLLVKAGATIADLLEMDRNAQITRDALSATDVTIAAGLRAILAEQAIDVLSNGDVSKAITDAVWVNSAKDADARKLAAIEPGAVKRPKSVKELSAAARTYYNKVQARISRLTRAIVNKPKAAPCKAVVRVSSAITSVVVAQKAAGMTKAQVRAQLLAALDRAFA